MTIRPFTTSLLFALSLSLGMATVGEAHAQDAEKAEYDQMQAKVDGTLKWVFGMLAKLGIKDQNGKTADEVLAGLEAKNITAENGQVAIDQLLNFLPNDSAVKPLIREFIKAMNGSRENLGKAADQE
jgi:hypothetical protein